jgi:integrase
MSVDLLTLDNPPLSDLKQGALAHLSAIDCKVHWSESVAALVRDSLSEATQRAYQCDLQHFGHAGWTIPATAEDIALYLVSQSSHSSIATIQRRLASIAKAHKSRGLCNPTTAELVRATLRGLKRSRGVAQRQAAPLLKRDLLCACQAIGSRSKDARDRALLLIGFAGGFRRSELVGLNWQDILIVPQGLEITIRRSKTDQNGKGRKLGIPYGRSDCCPVYALKQWQSLTLDTEGPVFRPVDRHHRISKTRLSGGAVSDVIRKRLEAVGIDPSHYSGHSLRSGFATSAAMAGVSSWSIRKQTGHASDATLARYIRDGELFLNNAAAALL